MDIICSAVAELRFAIFGIATAKHQTKWVSRKLVAGGEWLNARLNVGKLWRVGEGHTMTVVCRGRRKQ